MPTSRELKKVEKINMWGNNTKITWQNLVVAVFVGMFLVILRTPQAVRATTQTGLGTIGVTATVATPPPTTPAIITQPVDNAHFDTVPLVVSGSCGAGLLVRIFDNDELAGSAACSSTGTFIMNITLVVGSNALTVLNYDDQDQAGPASSTIHIFVDSVTPPATSDPGTADTGTLIQAATPPDNSVSFFAQTPLAPIAKIIDSHLTISPTIHSAVATAVNMTFAVIITALISLIFSFIIK